jgi:hypothetical protein
MVLSTLLLLLSVTNGIAADMKSLSFAADVQELKSAVLDLNRELSMLEEELLFPANTQVAVFMSMDVGMFFALDSVQLRLNGKEITNYLYTEREVAALHRGGVQKLFLGNLNTGEHELVAIFTGVGPHGRDYRRGATLSFEKKIGAKFVELQISDKSRKLQPEFLVREWEFVANYQFQGGLRSYRDLLALRERLPEVEQRLTAVDSKVLRKRLDDLVMTLDMIEQSRNVIGLADSTEADQWSRLTALEHSLAWNSDQASAARDKHRILKGSLLWQLDRDFRYRLWVQRRAVADIENSLTTTGNLERRAKFMRTGMPLQLDEYGEKITALKPRIEAM